MFDILNCAQQDWVELEMLFSFRKHFTYVLNISQILKTLCTYTAKVWHPCWNILRICAALRAQLVKKTQKVSICLHISMIVWHLNILDSKSHGGATCTSSSTSSQASSQGVKSSVRVGNAASNSVESGGGALAHDGAGTSGIASTATANPPVSAAVSANPAHPHSTHKHLLRSRGKTSSEQYKELPSNNKTSGKHHKKDSTTGSCSSSR